jgi:hypothetical protein
MNQLQVGSLVDVGVEIREECIDIPPEVMRKIILYLPS